MTRNRKGVKQIPSDDIEDVCSGTIWQPHDWFSTLENIQHMRRNADAPVDTMGCDMLAKKSADPKVLLLIFLLPIPG